MKVMEIIIEELENTGCNNGNYPKMDIRFDTGNRITATTCRCGNGCSGTCPVPEVGMEFASEEAFWDWAG